MKLLRKSVFSLITIGIITSACSNNTASSTATNKSSTPRYLSVSANGDTILKDTKAGISWTNSSRGCKPIVDGSQAEVTKKANSFCHTLNFGGHTDWRVGTVSEVTTLEKQTDAQGIKLFYKNPMCRLVFAKKNDQSLTSVSTTNNSPVARVTGFNTPAGTRCVRNNG